MTAGRIILLNGASSSGKSSLARELLEVFDERWFHMPVDAFHAMRARKDLPRLELEALFRRTRQGYHGAVAGMVQAGNSVVADHVLSEPWRLADILEQWGGMDVVMVGLHCPLDELNRREKARRDREPGTAESQFHVVHVGVEYDCEVDTSAEGALEIGTAGCSASARRSSGSLVRTTDSGLAPTKAAAMASTAACTAAIKFDSMGSCRMCSSGTCPQMTSIRSGQLQPRRAYQCRATCATPSAPRRLTCGVRQR